MTIVAFVLAGALAVAAPAPATDPAPGPAADAAVGARAWRAARWGMTLDDVLAAFPGEATRLDPPVVLADGNVVAAGIDGFVLGAERLQVRFVFAAGRLALVSLRTPERSYAAADRYTALAAVLAAELGAPGEETKDDALVDLRERRWDVGPTRVDLKYIPGTVVVLYSPRS